MPNWYLNFLCFIMAELFKVQVLNHMEGQANLCGNSVEESKSQKDEHWMQLYLAGFPFSCLFFRKLDFLSLQTT